MNNFIAALPGVISDMNAAGIAMDLAKTAAESASQSAFLSASTATAASSAAALAAAAIVWVSNTTYSVYQAVISPSDFHTYRKITSAAGNTTDPSANNTDYVCLTRFNRRVTSITSSATPTPNSATTDLFAITALAVGATFAAPTGTPKDGQQLMMRVKDSGTAQALAYNAIYRASTDLPLPTSTVLSKTLYMGWLYNANDTKWDLIGVLSNV